ncbi:MAG: hypothetical protein QOG62_1874 [Thermoleophilaceae bacterium]|jgi:hypothetical protein|nr:hypothetical protein [Thermoleophilaceae bacterium]
MLTAIGQGAGLAAATGLRPFLPPLLVGVFARAGVGIDFTATPFAFLQGTPFLAVMFALTVAWYVLERRAPGGPHTKALPILGAALGALLFAGTMAVAGGPAWAGALAGAACGLLGSAASSGLLDRARRRLEAGAAAFLTVWVDLAALAVAALSIFVWPAGLVVLVPLVWAVMQGRRAAERKHEGLRTLR